MVVVSLVSTSSPYPAGGGEPVPVHPQDGILESAVKNLYRELENNEPVYLASDCDLDSAPHELGLQIEDQITKGIFGRIRTAIHYCNRPDVSPDTLKKLRDGLSYLQDAILHDHFITGDMVLSDQNTDLIYKKALKKPFEYIAASFDLADADEQADILRNLADAMTIFPKANKQDLIRPFLLRTAGGASLAGSPLNTLTIPAIAQVVAPYLGVYDSHERKRLDCAKIDDLAQSLALRHGGPKVAEALSEADAANSLKYAIFPEDWVELSGCDVRALSAAAPERLARVAHCRDHSGRTLLSDMVAIGDTDAASILLDAGSDANASDKYGTTPLIAAAKLANPTARSSMVKLLLSRGADAMLADNAGKTPVQAALVSYARELKAIRTELEAEHNLVQAKRQGAASRLRVAPPNVPSLASVPPPRADEAAMAGPLSDEALSEIQKRLDVYKSALQHYHERLHSYIRDVSAKWPALTFDREDGEVLDILKQRMATRYNAAET